MTKHRPDPWWFSAAEEGYYVAGVGDKELTNLIQKEDARLIAAAPELLEALRIALPYVQQTLHGHIKEYEYDFSNKAAIEKEREMKLQVITILNAIDLATGETE